MIPWDAQYKTHDAEPLALFRPSWFGGSLAGCKQNAESFKPDLSAKLPSSARPLNSPLSLDAFPLDTFQIDYLQAMTNGAVVAPSCYHFQLNYREVQANTTADAFSSQPLRKTFGVSRFRTSRFQASLSSFQVSCFRASLSYFEPHVYEPHSPGSTLLSLTFLALCTSSILIPLHQILVCGTFIQSHQLWDAFRSKLANGPTKPVLVVWVWGCKGKKQSGPDYQDQPSWITRLGRLQWGLIIRRFGIKKSCWLAENTTDPCDVWVTAT